MTRRARRLSHNQGDPDRTAYIPGENPREFGRQAARDVFEKHVLPLLENGGEDDKS